MRLRDQLRERFRDFTYRHSYVDTFIHSSLATQIKALREQRHLTQVELGDRAGMKQSQISGLESVDNRSWKISTLQKLARAFDLVLVVRFESFGNTVPNIESFGRGALERPSFNDDTLLHVEDDAGLLTSDSDNGQSTVIHAENRFHLTGTPRVA